MKKLILFYTILSIGGCSNPDESQIPNDPDFTEEEIGIILTDEQLVKIDIQYGKVVLQPLKDTRRYSGYIASHPNYLENITSLIMGRIAEVKVLPGQKVVKGQTLLTLENPDIIDWQREYLAHINEFEFVSRCRCDQSQKKNSPLTFLIGSNGLPSHQHLPCSTSQGFQ